MLGLTERSVEVPWAVANTVGPTLDVGCAESTYLADLNGPVDGIDVRHVDHERAGLRCFYHGDIRTVDLPIKYRTVLAVSTIEHIGLAHKAYGTVEDDVPFGDLEAVRGCVRAVEPGGHLLMSVPYGEKAENRGWYRVYNERTLSMLLNGYTWTADYHLEPRWRVGGVALVTVTA